MARCVCCDSILNSPGHVGAMINYIPQSDAWCDYCKMMVPCITGQRTDDISVIGRNTQGVKLIRLSEDDNLLGMEKVISEDDEK